ncbi:nitronate monooxygenase, partial [Chloroflexota bacterium]
FLEKISAGVKEPIKCPWKCLKTCDSKTSPYCICAALTNAKKGIQEKGFAFAGANAYRINTITSVKELIETLLTEYKMAAG